MRASLRGLVGWRSTISTQVCFNAPIYMSTKLILIPTEWKVWSQFVVRSARGMMRLVDDDVDEYAG